MPSAGESVTVVLDTNVVVAALLWDGIPRQLLEALAVDPFVTLAGGRLCFSQRASGHTPTRPRRSVSIASSRFVSAAFAAGRSAAAQGSATVNR